MARLNAAVRRTTGIALLVAASCSAPSASRDGGDVGPCTFASCTAECAAAGLQYGSCAGGRCNCASGDGDVTEFAGDARQEDSLDADAGGEDADVAPCEIRAPDETRPGAEPGVSCLRVSPLDLERSLLSFAGDGPTVAFKGGESPTAGATYFPLWVYDRPSHCIRMVDDATDVEVVSDGPPLGGCYYPSVDGDRVVYMVDIRPAPWVIGTVSITQLRLADLRTGERRTLVGTRSTFEDYGLEGGVMDFISLDYPWVAWRDVREANDWAWYPYAFNIETREERHLGTDPTTGARWYTVEVDLLGTTVVFAPDFVDYYPEGGGCTHTDIASVDLLTGVRTRLTSDIWKQRAPTITPDWIIYFDFRNDAPCGDDLPGLYGLERATGEQVRLASLRYAGRGRLRPDATGDWVVYEDYRGPTDFPGWINERDIYALYLPTRIEIRVTDWPGFEMQPVVYNRGDGTSGVLFIEEIDYGTRRYRRGDCDLPTPSTPWP